MFTKHGLEVDKGELRELFTYIAKKPTNELSLDQFKELSFSKTVCGRFHDMFGELRNK